MTNYWYIGDWVRIATRIDLSPRFGAWWSRMTLWSYILVSSKPVGTFEMTWKLGDIDHENCWAIQFRKLRSVCCRSSCLFFWRRMVQNQFLNWKVRHIAGDLLFGGIQFLDVQNLGHASSAFAWPLLKRTHLTYQDQLRENLSEGLLGLMASFRQLPYKLYAFIQL